MLHQHIITNQHLRTSVHIFMRDKSRPFDFLSAHNCTRNILSYISTIACCRKPVCQNLRRKPNGLFCFLLISCLCPLIYESECILNLQFLLARKANIYLNFDEAIPYILTTCFILLWDTNAMVQQFSKVLRTVYVPSEYFMSILSLPSSN